MQIKIHKLMNNASEDVADIDSNNASDELKGFIIFLSVFKLS